MSFLDDVETRARNDLAARQPAKPVFTIGRLVKSVVGAGLGAGVARGVSRVLGVSPAFADKLETGGMAAGAWMNLKNASDQQQAFRLGFLKAAMDLGWPERNPFVKEALIAITPESLLALPRGAAGLVKGTGERFGSLVGAGLVDPDEDDMTKLEAEETLYQEQLNELQRLHEERKLREILKKRRSRK